MVFFIFNKYSHPRKLASFNQVVKSRSQFHYGFVVNMVKHLLVNILLSLVNPMVFDIIYIINMKNTQFFLNTIA